MFFKILNKEARKFNLFETTLKSLESILRTKKPKRVVVAFSGGKDSTALLFLTSAVLANTGIPLTVITVDTLVENFVIRDHIKNFFDQFRKLVDNEIPCEIEILTPELEFTYWVCIIGRGYPAPTPWFRWCQRHLKMKPVFKFLRKLAEKENFILLTGHRLSESSERTRILKNRVTEMRIYNKNGKYPQYAPLLYWHDLDVWNFLFLCGREDVACLYKEARGECPLVSLAPKSHPYSARFGCWVCTVVRKDRSLENQAENNAVFKNLLEFKEWLRIFTSLPQNRTGYNRRGKYVGYGKGTLTIKARKKILSSLLELQKKLQLNLISDRELDIIMTLLHNNK